MTGINNKEIGQRVAYHLKEVSRGHDKVIGDLKIEPNLSPLLNIIENNYQESLQLAHELGNLLDSNDIVNNPEMVINKIYDTASKYTRSIESAVAISPKKIHLALLDQEQKLNAFRTYLLETIDIIKSNGDKR